MRDTFDRPVAPLNTVTLGGKGNQALIGRVDAAARHLGRPRAGMLGIIVEDWLAAWEASGGAGSMESPGCPTLADDTRNPLLGHRVPFRGADGGGVIVPFRPRPVPAAEEPEK